jgi:para-aminobenzoate synthetase component 1
MNEMGRKGMPFMFMIDYRMRNARIFSPAELQDEGILIATPGFRNFKDSKPLEGFRFEKNPISYQHYQEAFAKVMEAINRGDTFLLNLTFPTRLDTDLSLDWIIRACRAKYRLKFRDQFVVFSPEPFVITHGNTISSFPMKGTMDASIMDAEFKLMNDIKEISEHNTIVDLIRNDLSMVAKKVRVERFRYIDRIKTHERDLLQTSSKIAGELPGDWRSRVGDILLRLLPAGSISGAPKQKTMEIIESSEGYDRGWFTGVFGYFDGETLESAVMIRFIEQTNGQFLFKSGGGITHFSNSRQEYRELIEKVYLPV